MKNLISLITLLIFLSYAAKAAESNDLPEHLRKDEHLVQTISLQIGINGYLQDSKSYELALFPLDLAHSYEFYNNGIFNFSATTFYDNIGVKIHDTKFVYRVGERIDMGFNAQRYTPYLTIGFAAIRYSHNYQTNPVYGAGLLYKITKNILLVGEVNFQNVRYQGRHYDIVNITSGISFVF